MKIDVPWSKLTAKQKKVFLYGAGKERVQVKFRNRYGRVRSYSATYEGVVPYLQRRHTEAESDAVREQIEGCGKVPGCVLVGELSVRHLTGEGRSHRGLRTQQEIEG